MKKCLNCEKELMGKRRKYCSHECGYAWRMNNCQESKEKRRKVIADYYQRHREKIKKYSYRYYQDNKDKRKKYYQDDKNKQRRREIHHYRYNHDHIYRLNLNLSSSVRQSLKSNNLSKDGRHWEDLVGYSVQDLKEHIEKLFKPGMMWENHGEWHIDHIIPKSFFKYASTDDVEFKYCWSLHNLQPLWAMENMTKNGKW